MFDSLSDRLSGILDRLTRRGALTEAERDPLLELALAVRAERLHGHRVERDRPPAGGGNRPLASFFS